MTIAITDPGEPIRIGNTSLFQVTPPILIPRLGLIRAWDMNAVSGDDVTSVPAAFGTTVALDVSGSVGSADCLSDFSPSGANMLQTTASNSEVGAFTSTGALSAWTIAFVYAPTTLAANVPIISKSSSSTQSYVRFNVTSNQIFRIEYRPDSGTAQQLNLVTGQFMNVGACYVVVITKSTGGTIRARVNGVSASDTDGGGAYTFDQIYRVLGTTYATGLWGPYFAIWNRELSASEASGVEVAWGAEISRALYVSSSTGSGSNYGFSEATPLQTIASAMAKTQIIANGLNIGNFSALLKGGDEWVQEEILPPSSGTTLRKMIFGTYGAGRAKVNGCAATVGGWTDNLDGTYSRTLTYLPSFVQVRTESNEEGLLYEKLYNVAQGGTPSAYTYEWDDPSDTLTITPPPYFNPATTEVRIAVSTVDRCFDSSATNLIFRNLDMWFWHSIAFRPAATSGTLLLEDVDASYGGNDGLDCNTGPGCTVTFNDCSAHANGAYPVQSGLGDGFSAHSSAVANYNRCKAFYNLYGGLRSEAHTVEIADRCWFKGNARDIIRLAQGTGSGGSLTVRNTIIEVTAASVTDNGVEMENTLTGATFALQFLTVYGDGSAVTSKGVAVDGGAGGTITDCIFAGDLNTGIAGSGGGTAVQTYNCFDVNIPTSGGAITGGTGSINDDPEFTDAPAEDFTLQPTSPCVGAGIAISGVTTDYAGATRADPPTIGAYET